MSEKPVAAFISDRVPLSWRTITTAEADALCVALAPYLHMEPQGDLWRWLDRLRTSPEHKGEER